MIQRMIRNGLPATGIITGDLVVSGALTAGAATLASAAIAGAATVGAGLAVTGNSTATGVFLGGNGSSSAPTFSYLSETNSGHYRAAASTHRMVVAAATKATFSAAGLAADGGFSSPYQTTIQGLAITPATTKVASATLAALTDSDTSWNGTDLVCTLPPTPTNGEKRFIVNVNATALIVGRNTRLINGAASDLSLAQWAHVLLTYNTTAGNWSSK